MHPGMSPLRTLRQRADEARYAGPKSNLQRSSEELYWSAV